MRGLREQHNESKATEVTDSNGLKFYYDVWVSSLKYHGEASLTYGSDTLLEIGVPVTVPMQQQIVPAIVLKQVRMPSFKTKNIAKQISLQPLPHQLIELISWLQVYYPAPLGQLMSLILPATLTQQSRTSIKQAAKPKQPQNLPQLTPEQARVLKHIQQTAPAPILLHGDTGTGKTRIYLELIKKTLDQDKSALLLTPEIGLTPQLALACEAAFPSQAVIMHSDLSPATRRKTWQKILESPHPLVVVGARSAVFSPLKNLGVIVVDEFHETTYKQEQTPYYLTTRVAAKLARLHEAQLLLGSATPPVSDYYIFQQKRLPVVRMRESAMKNVSGKPTLAIIDLKKRELFTRSAWLADSLLQAIEAARQRKEQSLVFLNRRGTARLVLCSVCGWQATCPHCDLPLTYHGDVHLMHCHTCGYNEITPTNCRNCGAYDIIFRTIGTKSLVAELYRLFPDATVQRFDSDTSKAQRLEQQYTAIKEGAIDILVGTQMLSKGLDLPKLSVLGVVMADTSLSFPDYTAEERTFQLLTQVTGRVHRGHITGSVYIQTHYPGNPLLEAVLNKDYETFYKQQLVERQAYGYPPFRFMLKLTGSYTRQASAKRASQKLANYFRNAPYRIEVIGPSPAFIEKSRGRYHWQIVIKATARAELTKVIKELPASWTYDIDPIHLL